jgi:hypothetical protein
MTRDDLERRALELGLDKLMASDPEALRKAIQTAERSTGALPKDLHWTEEPATTFSCVARAGAQS